MQPLPIRTRRLYLVGLLMVFVGALPFLILYASGYHFTKELLLVETGGIYIGVEAPGAAVYINNEQAGRSTLLDRSVLRQNLKEGIYSIKVERDGYYPWEKVLTVVPSYVTDARAIFIPQVIEKVQLLPAAQKPVGATSTPGMSYLSVNVLKTITAAFTGTSTLTAQAAEKKSPTTTPVAESGNVGLFIEKGNLLAKYSAATSSAPANFCSTPILCTNQVTIEKGSEIVTHADFLFKDRGVAIYTTESGVYAAEIDIRSPKLFIPLYQTKGADFQYVNGDLVIKDGKKYFRLDGF
jgi:hypothetical protein